MKVLVVSELDDFSTSNVVGWLVKFGCFVIRLNVEDIFFVKEIYITENGEEILFTINSIEGKVFKLSEFDAVWYRRGGVNFSLENLNVKFDKSNNFNKNIYNHLIHEEYQSLKEFVINAIAKKDVFNSFGIRGYNKLIALQTAKSVGLKVPDTIISCEKKSLLNFYRIKNGNCITKGIQDILTFKDDGSAYFFSTSLVSKIDLEEMNEVFFYSLLQENIEKRYEIRVFYLNGKCYSMAIFSQSNENTKIDFRNYDWEKPNRNVPYKLPKRIEYKIKKFMDKIGLRTGSIDLIVTPDFEFVFLEVNPVGQYGMVSVPCNYNLDLLIAQEIVNYKKQSHDSL